MAATLEIEPRRRYLRASGCDSPAVEVRRAEELRQGVRTLDHQLGVVLPGYRDAAVQLDRLGGHLREGVAAPGLGDGGTTREVRALGTAGHGERRVHRCAAGGLDEHEQVGHSVLQRL